MFDNSRQEVAQPRPARPTEQPSQATRSTGMGGELNAAGGGGTLDESAAGAAGAAGDRAGGGNGGTGPNGCIAAFGEGGEAGMNSATLPELVGNWGYSNYDFGADYGLEVHADGTATYFLSNGDILGTFNETWSGAISVAQHVITLDATTVTTNGTQSEPGQSGRPSGTRTEPPQTLVFGYAYHADTNQLWLKECDEFGALPEDKAVPFSH